MVLGSATPSMESYQNALEGRYALVTLERRVLDRPLAAVSIVNMRDEMAAQGEDVVLSAALAGAIERRVASGRAGAAAAQPPRLRERGLLPAVRRHARLPELQRLADRAQGRAGPGPRALPLLQPLGRGADDLPNCAAPYLEHVGFGTERVEAEVRRAASGRADRAGRSRHVQRRGAIAGRARRGSAPARST